jgi:hypothetical protein
MKNRKRVIVVALAFVATIVGIVAILRAARSAIGSVRVEVVSVTPLRARGSNRELVDAGSPPGTGGELLQGHELMGELARDFRLTAEQRSKLDETLSHLAQMQAQIDGLPDARQRAFWQGELVKELIAALRDAVGDQGLETTLANLAAKQPRLVYESYR